ncbi:MAG TPA: hypothetical protein VFP05_06105 [Thermomicrobiales bacterium]|jgi:hypothetical protein|nr:hypothetical protein [Thermomicrobiales bacterium]
MATQHDSGLLIDQSQLAVHISGSHVPQQRRRIAGSIIAAIDNMMIRQLQIRLPRR